MGRKKRKVANLGAEDNALVTGNSDVIPPPPPPPPPPPLADPRMKRVQQQQQQQQASNKSEEPESPKKMSSGYATTSHSAEIIDEDIYVSDGSESDEDMMADRLDAMSPENEASEEEVNVMKTNNAGRSIEMVLSGSKMGLMRRGIHRPTVLVQPNRQWARQQPQQLTEDSQTNENNEDEDGDDADADEEERKKREQEEELAKLDPAQRAARLLVEKQRKLEEAKILARKLESEGNAGRDPCLFSKRTSFDIRFDQIDDKPWLRGAGDITDFFNYGFTEEDWLEYGEQQLMIRQELIDANRQKRPPDPSIVPVLPKKSKKQIPRVTVATGSTEATEEEKSKDGTDVGDGEGDKEDENSSAVIGPVLKIKTANEMTVMQGPVKNETSSNSDFPDTEVGAGGAWGMVPDAKLAKLIGEQDRQQQQWNNSNERKQKNETMHDASSDSSPRKGRQYHGNNSKYEGNNSAPSYYGNSSGGGDSGYKDNQSGQQNDHSYDSWNKKYNSQQSDENRHNSGDRNHRYQNHGGHNDRHNQSQNNSDWNSRSNNDRTRHHQGSWNDGGRGGYRGDNRGRRNGGDYGEGKGRNRGGNNNYGDRGGGYQSRKRPRDDHDDRYNRR